MLYLYIFNQRAYNNAIAHYVIQEIIYIKTKAIAIYTIRGDRVLSSNFIVIGSEESSTWFELVQSYAGHLERFGLSSSMRRIEKKTIKKN